MSRKPRTAVEPVAPEAQPAPAVSAEVGSLDLAIIGAVNAAKAAGLPQGLIVAVLQTHALKQTHMLLG